MPVSNNNRIAIFGIRHHGPGSARSLVQALDDFNPDIVLIEGPPEADAIVSLAAHEQMKPPVALLVYVPDTPRRCVFYPLAVFSPEWQAIQWALGHKAPARFMDLPQSIQMAIDAPEKVEEDPLRRDPLLALAEAAGYTDGERWWDSIIEQRADGAGVFEAILEAMTALRSELKSEMADPQNELREAFMRQTIRTAQREGYERIAVICGAWHAPALTEIGSAKAYKALLAGLPAIKTACSWIPWTYSRLSYESGYGAGIESPGWYEHLWANKADIVVPWMSRVARLLREQDLDASPASVIEAVRLAECLASLRGRPLPGLPELNEATQTVLCFGSLLPMRLIAQKLSVGETQGEVPDDAPAVPLEQDLKRIQKRLRLKPEPTQRAIDLDLRKSGDLERSELLHRMALLGIPWGSRERYGGGKGTFHELWRLQWHPEFSIALIERGIWGNTIVDAADAYARDLADKAPDLPALTKLLEAVLFAQLADALRHLMERLETAATYASDVAHLMEALPPLANMLRYGNVRGTDKAMVSHTVDGLIARVCAGLSAACASLDDDAADAMTAHIAATNGAVSLLQNEQHIADWREALIRLIEHPNLHGRIGGHCARLLLDADVFDAAEAGRRMSLALSTAAEPVQAAAWIEGFLAGNGLLLVHDRALFGILDDWVSSRNDDVFTALLPLLRRTFSTFSAPERRQIGERAASDKSGIVTYLEDDLFDHARAAEALPYAMQLLGISLSAPERQT